MTRAMDTLPQAIGLALLLVLSVLVIIALAAFVLWAIRYAKASAADRLAAKEHADAMGATVRDRKATGR